MKIGFSTALMNEEDWYGGDEDEDDVEDGPPVQFRFAAVHVLRAGVPVEAHVVGANFFVFDKRESDTPLIDPKWSNLETATESEIGMQTEKYLPMQFAFTKPGVYLVQAQIQGHVRQESDRLAGPDVDWSPISTGKSLTSPTEWYTFHVGPETDMKVEITHTDETADDDTTTVTDGEASFSVTATNNGPETAEDVVVEVSLPVGLDYAIPDPEMENVDYGCGVISWKVGDLNSGTSETLSFDANVSTGSAKTLTVDAEVHSATVDDNEANDTASDDVKTDSMVVTAPFFPGVTRSIVEHALEGTHAGEPMAALNPDGRQLTYTLEGRCADWFKVHNNGQIVLAADQTLDYDKQSEFHLTLQVSDGVNADGTTDTAESPDHWIPVTVKVIDGLGDVNHPTVTFSLTNPFPDDSNPNQANLDLTGEPPLSLSADTVVDIVPTFTNPPEGTVNFHWDIITNGESGEQIYSSGPADSGTIRKGPEDQTPATIEYKLHATWEGGGITVSYTINWVAPSTP